MTIFIIEGVDRTGKTTLANQLENDFGCIKPDMSWLDHSPEVWDRPGARTTEWERLSVALRLACQLSDHGLDVVFDRFIVSNHVYGKYDKHRSGNYDTWYNYFAELASQMKSCGTDILTVFLKPDTYESDGHFSSRQIMAQSLDMERHIPLCCNGSTSRSITVPARCAAIGVTHRSNRGDIAFDMYRQT